MTKTCKTYESINLLKTSQQSTYVEFLKPHSHLMMMQKNIRANKKIGERGNEALMK